MMLVTSRPPATSLYCARWAADITFPHLSAQFSGLACAKMCFQHLWSERVEKEAKPDQFSEEIHEVSYYLKHMFLWRQRLALTKRFFGLRCPHRREQWALKGLTIGKIAESWSRTDLWITTQNTTCLIHLVQTKKIMHRTFDSSSHLFLTLR